MASAPPLNYLSAEIANQMHVGRSPVRRASVVGGYGHGPAGSKRFVGDMSPVVRRTGATVTVWLALDSLVLYDTIRIRTIDDLHWKTDRQAASLI